MGKITDRISDRAADKLADMVVDNIATWAAMWAGLYLLCARYVGWWPWPGRTALVVATWASVYWKLRKRHSHWFVVFTRSLVPVVWRTCRRAPAKLEPIQRARKRGKLGELPTLADDRVGRDRALQIIQAAVLGSQPPGTGQIHIETRTPRRVAKIEQTPTATVLTVELAAVNGAYKAFEQCASGIAAQLRLPDSKVRIEPAKGGAANSARVTLTHSAPVAVAGPKTDGQRSVLQGVDMGATANADRIIFPVYEQHWTISGAPRQGKSNFAAVAARQIAACRDAQVWTLDVQGALGSLRTISTRYYDTWDAVRQAPRDLVALMEERSDLLRASGGAAKLTPSPDVPLIYVLADELPAILADKKFPADMLLRVLREGPKLCICVGMYYQQSKATAVPTEMTTTALVTVALKCRTEQESRNVLGGWHQAGYHANKLPGAGWAIAVLPTEDDPIRFRVHRDEGVSADVSAPVSDGGVGPEQPPYRDAPATPPTPPTPLPPPNLADGPVAERRTRIFATLNAAPGPVSGKQLAERTGIPRSTLLADLAALRDAGLLVHEAGKGWTVAVAGMHLATPTLGA